MQVIRATVTMKCRLLHENWPKNVCVQSMIRIHFRSASMKPFQLRRRTALFPTKSRKMTAFKNSRKKVAKNSEQILSKPQTEKKDLTTSLPAAKFGQILGHFGFWSFFVFWLLLGLNPLCCARSLCQTTDCRRSPATSSPNLHNICF